VSASAAAPGQTGGHAHPRAAAAAASGVYAPYAFLVGEWDLFAEAGGPALGSATLRWGPERSYIWYASSLLEDGKLVPHFEGILVWNGVRKDLDMLISMDLHGGRVQEKGSVSVEPDGSVVRDITATYSEGARPLGLPPAGPEGATAHFRQTFRAAGPSRVLTAALRDDAGKWVPTFPGSDHLAMERRPGGAR
jgi:hypothetical protein